MRGERSIEAADEESEDDPTSEAEDTGPASTDAIDEVSTY